VVLMGMAARLAVATSSTAAVQKTTLRQSTQALLKVGIPGAVVVTKKPGNVARIAAGVDLAATRRPILAGDRFRVGSLTKTFTATLVLQLSEEHRLSLGDSVEGWLPGLVPNGDAISVRQLLQHTSGLYDYAADPASFQPVGPRIVSVNCQSFLLSARARQCSQLLHERAADSRGDGRPDQLRGWLVRRTLCVGRGSRFPEERSFRLRSPSRGGALLASRRRLCAPPPHSSIRRLAILQFDRQCA
jgi:hypothetical protein